MAITEVYVDPAINANSGTGTIGDPYGDLQYALNTKARDATNGNRFNIKAGTAEVLSAALSLATYGGSSDAAGLVIQGYTSAAGDGGVAEISGAGSYALFAATNSYISLVDLYVHNCGNNNAIVTGWASSVIRCHVTRGASTPSAKSLINVGTDALVAGCYVHDAQATAGGTCIALGSSSHAIGNWVGGIFGAGISMAGVHSVAANNIVICNATGANGIVTTSNGFVIGNTVHNTTAGTGYGISASATSNSRIFIANNIVTGFSGAGGIGIRTYSIGRTYVRAGNAAYNNTTNFYTTGVNVIYLDENNDDLGASPFTDAASGAETKVNFTFGYAKDDAGRVRIVVHHSSLPYAPHP